MTGKVTLLLLLVTLVHSVTTLKCYTCNSALNDACAHPFSGNSSMAVDCSTVVLQDIAQVIESLVPGFTDLVTQLAPTLGKSSCAVTTVTMRGVSTVSRMCSPLGGDTCLILKMAAENTGAETECRTCEENLCNLSGVLRVTFVLLALPVLLVGLVR